MTPGALEALEVLVQAFTIGIVLGSALVALLVTIGRG